jgi:hypothetical protein
MSWYDHPLIPNAETIEAMLAARRGEFVASVSSVEELFEELNADEECIHDHGAEAIGVFWFPNGCFCLKDQLQPLCEYHSDRSVSSLYEMYEIVYWGA